jgi:para-nitrobenzyl esterase
MSFAFDNAELCDHYSAGDPSAFVLSQQMSAAWANFERAGNPNHDGLPNWPAYTAESRATMFFDTPCEVRFDPEGRGLKVLTQCLGGQTRNPEIANSEINDRIL